MKLYEIDDCSNCPVKNEGFCPGGWTCYGGEPIEPPCTSWDANMDVDDYIAAMYDSLNKQEEYEDRLWKAEQERKRKNEIAKNRRHYVNRHCIKERLLVRKLKRQIRKLKEILSSADTTVYIFNTLNESLNCPDRVRLNSEFSKRLDTLKKELAEAEAKLKEKQKACRSTTEYKQIGK